MAFKKGKSGNPAGRPVGTANKVSQEIRIRVNTFLQDNFELIQNDFMELEPRDRIRFYIDLLQFGLPKLKSIDTNEYSEFVEHKVIRPKRPEHKVIWPTRDGGIEFNVIRPERD
jgi:hypothetical protein